jgi:molybdenum cofactor cytidylyltransferase
MEQDRTHAVIVLAAGGSTRLGAPKQLLTRGGETLVHRAVRHAAATHPQRLVVVLGGYRSEVAGALVDLNGEHLYNSRWEEGLATSLHVAADGLIAHDGPVLIVGCDQPALEVSHLQRLLDGASNATSGCAATVHSLALGGPAVITRTMLQDSGSLCGDQGFGGRLSSLSPDSVWRLDAPELQLDIDNVADQRAAISGGWLDG